MEKKRLIWADSLKGCLIILVVLGHSIQNTLGADCEYSHLWNLIYSFHMPAFMAVSGFLAYRISKPEGGGKLFNNYMETISTTNGAILFVDIYSFVGL